MQDVTSGALLDAVRGVHWPARRVTRGALHGAHRSRRVGSSPEFSEYRPYQQGDDPSRIDWRLFGRTERVAIRLAHDDSSIRTGILLDASSSMAWPEETRAKWVTAASVALGLCAVAFGDGDPAGLAIGGGETPVLLPPRTRRDTVARIRGVLAAATPGGTAPLAPLLGALRTCRRIAIISDFLGDADALLESARTLVADGREIYAVHVLAPEEIEPGALGIVVDPERPAMRRTLDADQLERYRAELTRWRESLAAAWLGSGAAWHAAIAGEPADHIVRRVTRPIGPAVS